MSMPRILTCPVDDERDERDLETITVLLPRPLARGESSVRRRASADRGEVGAEQAVTVEREQGALRAQGVRVVWSEVRDPDARLATALTPDAVGLLAWLALVTSHRGGVACRPQPEHLRRPPCLACSGGAGSGSRSTRDR